jgi:hypothetical protein
LESVLGDGAAGSLDLGLGGSGSLNTLDGVGCRNLAVAQDLDRVAVTHGTLGDQIGNGDFATLREQFRENSNVDDLIFLLERALEATQLRMYSGSWPPSKPGRTW